MDALSAPGTTAGTTTPTRIVIPQHMWDAMQHDAAQRAPEEACGLLGGRIDGPLYQVSRLWPLSNALHSATRFRLDPGEQIGVFDALEAAGLELLAVYHSHPLGPDDPSATDITEAYYPEVVSLIWSGRSGQWQGRGFSIRQGRVNSVPVSIVE